MKVVTTRPTPSPSFGDTQKPRFSTLCVRSGADNAQASFAVKTGLPGLSAAASVRQVTATMKTDGHGLASAVAYAVITGQRFFSDKEAVPYPQGSPLLVLHDPPGGASASAF
jgi:hypothetical protein